jgi:hypothetical protein
VGLLFVSPPPIHTQESPAFKKCSSELADPDKIDPNSITIAEFVSLPSKIGRLQIT